jgi:TolB-like protein/tetratricopeptide (TPR) repeat protein
VDVTDSSRAVFLSYASQDADAAARICAALGAVGVEVWFDHNELRGGDAWDQSIRRQIKTCALFIPVISRHTHERAEGYFRLEWKLAVDRSHLIVANKAFLVPVVIDDTGDDDEHVPDKFKEIQWTRIPAGEAPPEFIGRIKRLLAGETSLAPKVAVGPARTASRKPSWLKAVWIVLAVVLIAAAGYLLVEKRWVAELARPSAFAPPAHSIAVLPFVNLSGDKEQEYFSDGLTEEILNSLAAIDGLRVAARTSSFSFKEHPDIGTVAHKLNVGAVLEGSVRRSENTIRVTAQLIDAVTGFHLWSKTYDRDLRDVLELQTEIATSVAGALKVALLGDVAAKIEVGGTRNPAAFDAYLRGRMTSSSAAGDKDLLAAIDAFSEAIRLDPGYALAYAWRSLIYSDFLTREFLAKQEADAREAIRLAPGLAEGYDALGRYFDAALDFTQARENHARALTLSPGSGNVLIMSAGFLADLGQFDEALSLARRAAALDPLNENTHFSLGVVLFRARRYQEANASFSQVISLSPGRPDTYVFRGLAYYFLGDLERAKSSCEATPADREILECLAIVYDKLGRHADAQSMLAKLKAQLSDAGAYFYTAIYAQWGKRTEALDWLDTAMRLRDPGLQSLKTDPLMDPLRQEPRFQAIERALKFP